MIVVDTNTQADDIDNPFTDETDHLKGENCAMVHLGDAHSKLMAHALQFICHTDAFDPQIEDGWTINIELD